MSIVFLVFVDSCTNFGPVATRAFDKSSSVRSFKAPRISSTPVDTAFKYACKIEINTNQLKFSVIILRTYIGEKIAYGVTVRMIVASGIFNTFHE